MISSDGTARWHPRLIETAAALAIGLILALIVFLSSAAGAVGASDCVGYSIASRSAACTRVPPTVQIAPQQTAVRLVFPPIEPT